MKTIRYMYVWSTYILGAPAIIAFVLIVLIYNTIDCKINHDFWYNPIEALGAFMEGAKQGHKFNMHWAKTGECDFSYLMY